MRRVRIDVRKLLPDGLRDRGGIGQFRELRQDHPILTQAREVPLAAHSSVSTASRSPPSVVPNPERRISGALDGRKQ